MLHSFASQLVMMGVTLKVVQELLGHSTMRMTMRYAHLSPDSKARFVEVLDSGACPSPAPNQGQGLRVLRQIQ